MSEQALREAVLAAAADGIFPDGRAGRFLSAGFRKRNLFS